jgi:hypothetical protein
MMWGSDWTEAPSPCITRAQVLAMLQLLITYIESLE